MQYQHQKYFDQVTQLSIAESRLVSIMKLPLEVESTD
jgi:hypothetical protein